jgi:uncharacterized protein (DUF1800 family)
MNTVNNFRRGLLKHSFAFGAAGICGASASGAPALGNANANRHSTAHAAAHLANRLGFGPRPQDLAIIAADPSGWIAQQLKPRDLPLPESLTSRLKESVFLNQHPMVMVQEFRSRNQNQAPLEAAGNPLAQFVTSIARPAIESRLLRALESPRQLEEVMVDFWFNHFNVFQGKNILRVLMGHYEHYAIRPFAMGKFSDLLKATAHHPAMLYYLDNALSAGNVNTGNRGLNENYARELMELHTLGVDGGYSQKDVTELARMLTGWSIQPANAASNENLVSPGNIQQMPGFLFNTRTHDQGAKEWLGHAIAPQGKAEGDFALDTLAKHPATARHICYKIAQYFVNDQPEATLVKDLTKVFLESDGAITQVLTSLFQSESFRNPKNVAAKFKTPLHYVLSTVRALGVTPDNMQVLSAALAAQGMPMFGCPTPDGYKNTESAWLNPDAMTKRINFANRIASGGQVFKSEPEASSLTLEALITNLGPLATEKTKSIARENADEPSLAKALLLAGPAMMRR